MSNLFPPRARGDVDELLRALARTVGMQALILTQRQHGRWLIAAECGGRALGMAVGDEHPSLSALCAVVERDATPLVVTHASPDDVFARERGIVSYVGVPVQLGDGSPLGVLLAVDQHPRLELRAAAGLFEELGRVVAHELLLFDEARASREALERETENSGSRERFLAAVAHDLRTPIAAIRSAGTLLQRRPADLETVINSAGSIVRSAARMERMIADLLDMARGRIGAGIPIAKRSCLEAPLVITGVIEETALAFPNVVLDVVIDLSRGLAVRWDLDRIAQCIGNLLSNACTHGVGGESVEVRVFELDEMVVLTMRNAGEIPSEILATLLDPLRAASGKRRVGLGLFIAGRIAYAHGGSIEFANTNGTTLTRLTLPKVTQPTSRRHAVS